MKTYKIYKTTSKLSDVIKNLQTVLEQHGDYTVEAWQHPEEEPERQDATNVFIDFKTQRVLIS